MDNSAPDLSKIITLIMENPKLVSDIKDMIESNSEGNNATQATESLTSQDPVPIEEEVSVSAVPEQPMNIRESAGQKNRKKLLTAFKPYLSGERSRAIDSMLSIADIIDAMKAR